MAVADLPVIASSDRSADLENFCNRTYNADLPQWREVFPWEFPQKASKEDEEAFLQRAFGETDIHMYGYRFLKQAWYSMALWNFQVKMPCIADWYIQNNQAEVNDASVAEHILRPDVEVSAFFEENDVKTWGEKMLKNVIPLIQSKVKELKEQEEEAQRTPKATVKLPDPAQMTVPITKAALSSHSEATPGNDLALAPEDKEPKWAPTEKASADLPPPPDHRHRSRANSSTSYVPAIQNRKRGNSFGKHYNNPYGNRNPSMRYELQRGPPNPYYNSQQPAPPAFVPSPVIGQAPPHPPQGQMRVPTGGAPPFIPGSAPYPQAYHGPPPPPGMYGPMPPHPSDPHMQQQMPMQYPAQGFVPYEQQQPFEPHMGGEPFYDRSNNRFGNRGYGHEQMPTGNEYDGYGRGGRRDSNASRGKSRGGRASRGRNSFVESRPQNFADGYGGYPRRPSQDFGPGPEHQGFGYKQRRKSTIGDRPWRNTGPPMQQNENMQPGRMFSEPPVPTNAPPPSQPLPQTFGSPEPMLQTSRENRFPRREFSRPSQPVQPQPYLAAPPKGNLIHDENDLTATAFPERVITNHKIGMQCGHVKKVILFGVPPHVKDDLVSWHFSQFGTVSSVKRLPEVPNRPFRDILIKYETHTDARKALTANETHWEPMNRSMHVEVPKEYWDVTHWRYPGEGHPEFVQPPSRQSFTSAFKPRFGHRAAEDESLASDSAPPTAPLKEQKETLSESSTPTASGATSPKRKPKKTKNKKGQALREYNSQTAGKQDAKIGSDEHTADAKSETSEATVIHSSSAVTDTSPVEKAVEDSETTPPAPKMELSDSAIGNREAIRTKSAPPPSAEAPATGLPKQADITENEETSSPDSKVVEQSAGGQPSDSNAPQLFREPAKEEEKAAISEDNKPDKQVAISSLDNRVKERAAVSESSSETQAASREGEDEPADDSFHTADGTPESQKNSSRRDRGSEESTGSASSAGTLVVTRDAMESEQAPRPKVNLPTEAGSQGQESDVLQKKDGIRDVTSTESTASTKGKKKAAVPNLPKVKIVAEPSSRRGSGNTKATDQSSNSLAPPPTPGFVTAPTTPAVPSFTAEKVEAIEEEVSPTDAMPTDDTADAGPEQKRIDAEPEKTSPTVSPPQQSKEAEKKPQETSEVAAGPSQPSKKVEKARGPSQTESFSMFAKKAQPKPKKTKAQKVKGSIKGKPKPDDDATSGTHSESMSRVVSGTDTPRSMAEDVFGPSDGKIDSIDERLDSGRDDPKASTSVTNKAGTDMSTASQQGSQGGTSRDASPSKSRHLGNFFGLFGSAPTTQANTPDLKGSEPSAQTPLTDSKSDNTVPEPQAEPVEATDQLPGAKSADDAVKNTMPRAGAPPAPMKTVPDDNLVAGDTEQPFRSFRAGDVERGVRDSGDSGGATAGALGLGITADADTSSAAAMDADAAVSEEAQIKAKTNRKKRKGKKKGKTGTAAKDNEGDEEDAAEVVGETEVESAATASDMRVFTANSQDRYPKAASEAEQTMAPSEPGSEASSATLGRTESREQTPSSTAATSSQQSPSKMMNMIKKKSDGHLVQAPSRRKPNKRVISTTSNKTPEASSPSESGPTTIFVESEDNEGSDDESENPLDRVLEGMNKSSMRRNPPTLFLYVGEGTRHQQGEESSGGGRSSARDVAEQNLGNAEDMARSRLDGQGQNARPQ